MTILSHTLTRALLAGTLLSTFLPVGAQAGPSGRRGCGNADATNRCNNLPELTKSQQAAVDALADKHRPALEAKRKVAGDAREALRQGQAKTGVDRATLKALFDKESQARFDLLDEHQALRQETEKVLTPEQLTLWEQRRTEGPRMGGGARGGMGMGGGRGMGEGRAMGMGEGRMTGHGMNEGSCPQGQH